MNKLAALLNNLLDTVVTLIFVFMLFCAIMQVVFRYVLQVSVPWTEEAARFALILVTFWGAAAAIREKEHITILAVFERIPTRPRMALQAVFIIAIAFFLFNVFMGSFKMVKLTWNTPVGSISWLTTGKVYLFLPSGIILMMVYLAAWMVETIRIFFQPGKPVGKGAK